MFQIANLKIICTDSTDISFSKLRSACLNCHVPKLFFSLALTVQGGINLHCSFTFFIFHAFVVFFRVARLYFNLLVKPRIFSGFLGKI